MKTTYYASVATLALLGLAGTAMAEGKPENDLWTDVILVTGHRAQSRPDTLVIKTDKAPLFAADAATLAVRIPGGALNNNGAISGQIQYRGLYGFRIATTINGQMIGSGGPNLMDPPLHYAPLPLLDRLESARGIAAVSKGPGLGGAVNAVLKRGQFTNGPAYETQLDVDMGYRSVNHSGFAGGLGAIANEHTVLEAFASYETGGNTRFPGGKIADTGFERQVYGAGYGYRGAPGNEMFVEYRHQDTDHTGNAPFPMDIRFFDTDIVNAHAKAQWGDTVLQLRAGYSFVDHAMNNFALRPPPADRAKYRESLAQALTWTYGGDVSRPMAGGTLSVGVDGTSERHNTRIINPNNANFIVQNFNRYEENRLGGFAQWSGDPLPGLMVEAGVRLDTITTKVGNANASFVFPAPVQMLAMRFNAKDRKVTDHNVDVVLRTSYTLNDQTTLRLGLARKERTPMYVERYGWLPIPASAGLADGNIYVGDVGLKPETAHVLDMGVDWQGRHGYFRPSVYYRRIHNYIAGVPYDDTPGLINTAVEMVASANGDPTPLRFANVDAELYGLDADFGFAIAGPWRVDGVASFVRGKRRDIKDDLYRITPPRLSTTLSYMGTNWSSGVQMVAMDSQNKVSLSNAEQATGGAVLINLMARWEVRPGLSLSGGVENLFDRTYQEHLSGYNRVMDSGVAMGDRLPGAGRGVYLRLGLKI